MEKGVLLMEAITTEAEGVAEEEGVGTLEEKDGDSLKYLEI